MNDSIPMTIIDGGNDLWENSRSFFFPHLSIRDQMIEDFTAASMFRHEIDGVLWFHHLIETRDVGMMEKFQDGYFTESFRQVFIVKTRFVDNFNGDLCGEWKIVLFIEWKNFREKKS